MSENPRRGRQARNFTTNVPKLLDLKSSSEQIFFRKLSLGAPEAIASLHNVEFELSTSPFIMGSRAEKEGSHQPFQNPQAWFFIRSILNQTIYRLTRRREICVFLK